MVGAGADFGVWSASAFDAERYAILLSIFHYRAIMLQHGSLLMRVLERVTGATKNASSGALQDAALSLLSNYLRALRDWLRLINGILRHGRSFLSRNAVWWTSNYMSRCPPSPCLGSPARLTDAPPPPPPPLQCCRRASTRLRFGCCRPTSCPARPSSTCPRATSRPSWGTAWPR